MPCQKIRAKELKIKAIHQFFESEVDLNPDLVAAWVDGESFTYAQLNQYANQLARHLLTLGIEKEQRVAIGLDRGVDVLIAMMAILKVGACYVPLDPKQPKERLAFILNDSGAKACITKINLSADLDVSSTPVVFSDDPKLALYSSHNLDIDVSLHQLAYIIYTSGTTGNPKGVLIEHHSVVNYAQWFSTYSNSQKGMCIDWSSNHMFDMAVTCTIVPLMLGLSVSICGEEIYRHFPAYLRHLVACNIDIIKITPSYFKELLREIKISSYALTHLKLIILGGEQLSASDCSNWLDYYPNHCLANEYGPTEATVAFSVYLMRKNTPISLEQPAPIGYPGQQMYGYILDSEGRIVAEGEEGELYIGGEGLARGYLNLSDLTAERFVGDPLCVGARLYKTGDLCRQLSNGPIEYLGRIDRQVKIRGFRVELTEVEQCLEEHVSIQDAVVFVRENKKHDKQLVAYYIPKDHTQDLSYADIRDYLLQKLPHYMIPVSILRMSAFPMSPSGKLDESLLPLEAIKPQGQNKPRTNLERIIAKIWAKELDIPSVGIDESFWDLGGHSFIAARIIAKINQVLDLNITPKQLYEALTVHHMAKMVQGMNKHVVSKKDAQKARKMIPLSDFQTILWACKTFKPEAAKLNIIARKRLQGQLDIERLQLAFDRVIQKHPILSYQISSILPIQLSLKKKPFQLITQTLETSSEEEMEYILWDSMDELAQFSSWSRTHALIRAKLFRLKDDVIELQMAIPHMISDGLSMDILFFELSEFYLFTSNTHTDDPVIHEMAQFSDYVYEEQRQHQERVQHDQAFWTQYLKDAYLFSFLPQYIVEDKKDNDFRYSTYIPLPAKAIHHLEVFCRREHVNFTEALSAVLARALTNCQYDPNNHDYIFMNVVKSCRDPFIYDETVGCFIRIEPIKFYLNRSQTLGSLLNQVREFIGAHIQFQQSSSVVKLASINSFYRKKKDVKYFLAKSCIFVYQKLLNLLKLKHDALTWYPSLSLLDSKNQFMVYLNIWNNFANPDAQSHLFGLPSRRIKMHQHDLLTVDYLFEVCFLRDENHKPYVVISSNLTQSFKELIGNEIIRIMNEEMLGAELMIER